MRRTVDATFGIIVDYHLTFIDNVDSIVSRCNIRLYFMTQLKVLGMNVDSLRIFVLVLDHFNLCITRLVSVLIRQF